ncbi:MAG: metallopeptidase family protein, partial [bacterium]|nr:metallopeptidase family protein [bacterium]
MPERFKQKITNLALLIEDEVSDLVREEEGLEEGESLLGLYHGIPLTERGSEYGVGGTLPDTITLYRLPILEEASEMDRAFRDAVRIVVRETLWHEVGHYFGLPERGVNEREEEGTNRFDS